MISHEMINIGWYHRRYTVYILHNGQLDIMVLFVRYTCQDMQVVSMHILGLDSEGIFCKHKTS